MKTIIQKIGPLYGEAVNGSVFGQPNGSVYTPPFNSFERISRSTGVDYVIENAGGHYVTCRSDGTEYLAATFRVYGQVPYKLRVEISGTSDFAAILSMMMISGTSNPSFILSVVGSANDFTLVNGTTYYVRVQMLTTDGHVMQTSETFAFEGIV